MSTMVLWKMFIAFKNLIVLLYKKNIPNIGAAHYKPIGR